MSQNYTLTEKRLIAIEVLSNRNSIKGMFSELHFEDLSKLVDRVNNVFKSVSEQKEAYDAENQAKIAKIKEINSSLADLGLTLEDLAGVAVKPAKQRKNRVVSDIPTFTFEYVISGVKKSYKGKLLGNKPTELKNYLSENGVNLEDIVVDADRERLNAYLLSKK